jgi:hypothetical protein
MDESKNITLQKEALRLDKLNRAVIKSVVSSDWYNFIDTLKSYIDTKKKIKTLLIDTSVPQIHDKKAQNILRALAEEKSLKADEIITSIEKGAELQYPLGGLSHEEVENLGSDLFYSWFSHYEYIEAMYELGVLIVSISVPDVLRKFVDEARNCYAFQQYNAVYSLCRTILETAIRDISYRKKPRKKNIYPLEQERWASLKNAVAFGTLRDNIDNLYTEISSMIHGRKTIKEKDAKEAFRKTLEIIHALYEKHGY